MIHKLLTILFILFLACGRRESMQQLETDGTIRVIDLTSEAESSFTNISNIASDVEYIPLETNENSLIMNIGKVVACKNNIYIKNNVNSVMCFNEEGEFLYKLDKRGRGPEEFNYLSDFDISSDNKKLLILSGNKIMIFNNTGIEFVFSESFNLKPPSPSKIDFIPNNYNILLSIDPVSGEEPSLSLLLNINGDTLFLKPNCYKYNKTDNITSVHAWESLHYKFSYSVCFREEFSDTVFSVNSESNSFIPSLILDSHEKIIPPQARGDKSFFQNHPGKMSFVYTILEVPKYIIYLYEYDLKRYRVIYDKSTNKKFGIALENALIDDICGGPNFDPVFCSENKLYSSVDALTLKDYVASEDFTKIKVQNPKKKEKLEELANSLIETDNPILVVVTPKK